MTSNSNGDQYGEMEAFENVNLITSSGYYSLDDNIADSITWKRTKPDKINNEAYCKVKASKIDAIKEEVRHTKLDLDAVKQEKTKIESSDHDNVIETSKDDRTGTGIQVYENS